MQIENQFNLIAKEYDEKRRLFIPCFDDYYIKSTDFIASFIAEPRRILDLGAGTGLLSIVWHRYFSKSEYVLTDIAEEMLEMGKKRFGGLDNISFEVSDYTKGFPGGDFDAIISALSIHHLDNPQKSELFSRIYDKLPTGGLFVNYDQFCAGDEMLDPIFDSYWENSLNSSGLSEKDIQLWKERRKLDRECSVEEETDMLRNCGFGTVKCIYSNLKFAVIIAMK